MKKGRANKQSFPVFIEHQTTGGYVVVNPAFEGCYSQGDTIEEALENIREATEVCIETSPKKHSFSGRGVGLHLIEV